MIGAGVFTKTITASCPRNGVCVLIQEYIQTFLAVILFQIIFFSITIIPCFSWKKSKRKLGKNVRILFSVFTCITFYFWLCYFVANAFYCFGFLSIEGPCKNYENRIFQRENKKFFSHDKVKFLMNCSESSRGTEAKWYDRSDFFLILVMIGNFLSLILLVISFVANLKEAFSTKTIDVETLETREDVQKLLSLLIVKPPEVGHFVTCFHKSSVTEIGMVSKKVITHCSMENFSFNSWQDFSEITLMQPSRKYPLVEVNITLNFFPGNHFTAEQYKAFVLALTKKYSIKDKKITIDDYFHIEDHQTWFFRLGDPKLLYPWWDRGFAKIILASLFLAWPLRLCCQQRIFKQHIEVKKAVFCEDLLPDNGHPLQVNTDSEVMEKKDSYNGDLREIKKNCNGKGSNFNVKSLLNEEENDLQNLRAKKSHLLQNGTLNEGEHESNETMIACKKLGKQLEEPLSNLLKKSNVVEKNAGSTSLNDIKVQLDAICGYETYV